MKQLIDGQVTTNATIISAPIVDKSIDPVSDMNKASEA